MTPTAPATPGSPLSALSDPGLLKTEALINQSLNINNTSHR